MLHTRLTSALNLRYPVVSAPMIQASDARLATAVTGAGGLGLIGGAYGDRDWIARQLETAAGARVGWGFITWSLDHELLDTVLEAEPAAIFLSFGSPGPFADCVKDRGVPLMCQAGTLAQAAEAIDAGADIIVAQGAEAGGHGTGTRSTFTLVPEVADLAAERAPGTMVLAAGGVTDGRALAAALALGADGALVGTRLWASAEAAVPAGAHSRALMATGDDTVRTSVYDIVRGYRWAAPYTARVLRNKFVDRWNGHEEDLRANLPQVSQVYRRANENADFATAPLIAGEGIGRIREILPTGEILARMTADAEAILGTTARG